MKAKDIKQNTDKSDIEKLTDEVLSLKLELIASTKSVKELSKPVDKLSKKCATITTDSSSAIIRTYSQLAKGKRKELNRKRVVIKTDSSGVVISTDSSGAGKANLNKNSGAGNANHSLFSKGKHKKIEYYDRVIIINKIWQPRKIVTISDRTATVTGAQLNRSKGYPNKIFITLTTNL